MNATTKANLEAARNAMILAAAAYHVAAKSARDETTADFRAHANHPNPRFVEELTEVGAELEEMAADLVTKRYTRKLVG